MTSRDPKPLFVGGELNKDLNTTIKKALGPPADDIIIKNDGALRQFEAVRDNLISLNDEAGAAQVENEIDRLERENEDIEARMSLRDRVKLIFKRYGFTVTAVIAAVGAVIGVIVSNLKSGLSTVAKGVGNGLKALGKKLGEILPGMVGAIASFIFKTAGEVVGFLAEHAWLLIVAVVMYFIEQLKNKKKTK